MNKFFGFLIAITLIISAIYLMCDEPAKPPKHYKVEEFKIIKTNIDTDVDGGYNCKFSGKSNIYYIVLTNKEDTIRREFITEKQCRFFKGDSVFECMGAYRLKY